MKVIETTRLTVRMERSLLDKIEKLAAREDRDKSYVARQALRQYVAVHATKDAS